MRVITHESVTAFMNGYELRKQNMIVDVQYNANEKQNQSVMYLHGNKIAVRNHGNNKIFISNAGWNSNTTKERLNGIPGVKIYQKNWQWYLNEKKWNGEWIEII